MTVFTNVSDDVLEPGDPIRSVDILAIKNNAVFVGQFVNEQIFNANGTWTKPLQDGVEIGQMARIQVWGGGGGGGRASGTNACTGGGGAGYNEIYIALSSLGATESVTIASGGIGGSSAGFKGGVGGTTTFGSLISAFGGGGGISSANQIMYAGGGGPMGAGSNRSTTEDGRSTIGYGDPKPDSIRDGFTTEAAAFQTLWHGGAAYSSVLFSAKNGSPSLFGGAGGGSAEGTNNRTGGVSLYGGNGGNGGRSTTGINGVQPGGGGGGRNNSLNGGVGAAGRVIVTVW